MYVLISVLDKMFLIILFVIFGNSVHDCNEIIGNYTDFNEQSCGIYRLSPDKQLCFKWHIMLSSGLIDARNSYEGQSPWSVLLHFQLNYTENGVYHEGNGLCGGALIDKQWIITAAHCISEYITNQQIFSQYLERNINPNRFYVHLNITNSNYYENENTEYWSDEKYWHPEYIDKRYNSSPRRMENDIALLKLNKPVKIIPGIVNTICLPPERHFALFGEQRAVVSGFDSKPKDSSGIKRLQISNWKVSSYKKLNLLPPIFFKYKPYLMANKSGFIWPGRVFATNQDSEKICEGDSGSPMWQYYHGRAVLIGLLSEAELDPNWYASPRCLVEEYSAYLPNGTRINSTEVTMTLTWLPMKIGWIKNVTKLK